MAKLSKDLAAGPLHPRETIFGTGNLGSLNAEVIIASDGCAAVAIDLRGTFNLTVEVSGTLDGVNWTPIAVKPVNQAAKLYVAAVTGSVAGVWVAALPAPYRQVRARVTAYTSGAAATTLVAATALPDLSLDGMTTPATLGAQSASAGAAITLTLASPGAGLRHYLTYLAINRFATALLTASATPVSVTTTNLPTSLAFLFAADAAPQGSLDRWREDFAYPIAASAQNTATSIVCPATTGVIWRVTAGFYVAP
jgi:hypothetical protein